MSNFNLKKSQCDKYIREAGSIITEEFKIKNKEEIEAKSSLIASRMEMIFNKAIAEGNDKLALESTIALQKLYSIGKDRIEVEKVETPYSNTETADLLALVEQVDEK